LNIGQFLFCIFEFFVKNLKQILGADYDQEIVEKALEEMDGKRFDVVNKIMHYVFLKPFLLFLFTFSSRYGW